MTLSDVQNEEFRLQQFPVAREKVFLAHAGDCPLPKRVADAISTYAGNCCHGDQETLIYPDLLTEGRRLAAKLLLAQPDEISFVGPTSLGLSLVAGGLRFRRGDNILIYFDDYPSNVYPWMALAEKGVEVRLMNTRALGFIRPQDVIGQVDENTRLVALASCHFISGYRIQLDAIGQALHQRNILFCVDGIQTLGAFPTTVAHVDFLAADAHKWLLGPCGAGLLYVRKNLQERVNPQVYGWHNVRNPNFVAQEQIEYRSGPQRFEAGTHNLLGIVGLIESLKIINEVGVENIAADLLRKRSILVPGLLSRGYTVLQADAGPENASGIISFYHPHKDMTALQQALLQNGFITSLRIDRKARKYVRLSPHFYILDRELEQLLTILEKYETA